MTGTRSYTDLVDQLNRLQRTIKNWTLADQTLSQGSDQYDHILATIRAQGAEVPTLPEDMQADLSILQLINSLIRKHRRYLVALYERTLHQLSSSPEWTDTRVDGHGMLHYQPRPTPESPRSYEDRLDHLVERITREEWSEGLMQDIFTTIMEPDGIEALTHAYTHQSPR